ncbi:metallophosphoesterase family protein [Roseobacter weihaiensis]|uniref:metallophosphoesterase family protein n=1 Tax=Roseobacter weihaiensis TaxID=2763262 RepID=UPI0029CAC5B7|nr:metallophosphoesterase family protein [Roseobacter sp. H9]
MHRDLGVIDGALLLFGGPYSNLQAMQAVMEIARDLGISGRNMICTGDVVAYAGDPAPTVALVRESGATVVAGNCEKQLAQGALDCGCGFEEGSACDLLSAGWYSVASAQIGPADRAWMAGCPDLVSFRHQGARYAVIHGGVSDIARFIWPSTARTVFEQEWALIEERIGPVDHVIAGHSGLPFIRQLGAGRWINPGVIGMPPHDGAQQTRYGVLDGGEVLIHRLSYDVEAAHAAMLRAGLNQGYHTALRSGYWPSEEVLPAELRASSLARG